MNHTNRAITVLTDRVRAMTTRQIIDAFDATETVEDDGVYVVRGVLMDELEHRNPSFYDVWIDSNDASPRATYLFP